MQQQPAAVELFSEIDQLKARLAEAEQRERELPNGIRVQEEVEFVTDYSWRNFFSNINYAKIMQKLSKHRSHRIWLLVQYKSSVRPTTHANNIGLLTLTLRFVGHFETNS